MHLVLRMDGETKFPEGRWATKRNINSSQHNNAHSSRSRTVTRTQVGSDLLDGRLRPQIQTYLQTLSWFERRNVPVPNFPNLQRSQNLKTVLQKGISVVFIDRRIGNLTQLAGFDFANGNGNKKYRFTYQFSRESHLSHQERYSSGLVVQLRGEFYSSIPMQYMLSTTKTYEPFHFCTEHFQLRVINAFLIVIIRMHVSAANILKGKGILIPYVFGNLLKNGELGVRHENYEASKSKAVESTVQPTRSELKLAFTLVSISITAI